MTTPVILKVVTDALQAQLADGAAGLNARLAVLRSSYTFELFQFNFGPESVNFLFGRVDPLLLEQTSAFTFPFLTIDVLRAADERTVKTSTFAGPITAIIEVHHSWPNEAVLADFGAVVNATADAVLACLNAAANQNWPGNLLWNGRAEMLPGPLRMGAENWLKTTQFICRFTFTV